MKRIFSAALLLILLLCSPAAFADGEIRFTGNGIETEASGAVVEGSILTISEPGEYTLSGTLDNGQIIVNTGEAEGKVTLILNGVELSNLSGPVLVAEKAEKLKITVSEGTINQMTSGTAADAESQDEDADGAVIYSQCDLTIRGMGELSVKGYINNGITCKKDLDIKQTTLNVWAAHNGIKGTRSVHIKNSTVTIRSGNDGIKSTCTTREGKGWIRIENSALTIEADGDGISAATDLTLTGGMATIRAGKDLYNYGATGTVSVEILS